MMKALICATVPSHIKAFHLPYIAWLRQHGWEVHVAVNGQEPIPEADKQYSIPIQRSPFRTRNWTAFRKLKRIIDDERYDLIHCHTPMGGVITRLAAMTARRQGTKVLYTAHGFHFFRGASMKHWLLYYPIEKLLSRCTDVLFTMNDEDYERAQTKHFKAKQLIKVNGVGINLSRFHPVSPEYKLQLRKQFHLAPEDYIIVYCAEFITRKNHHFLLKVLAQLKQSVPQVKLLLAGNGELVDQCKATVNELGLGDEVKFLGFYKQTEDLYALSDVTVSTSYQEGLPVHIMEALASGIPAVVSDVRGNRDLVRHGVEGYVVSDWNVDQFCHYLHHLHEHADQRQHLGLQGVQSVQKYEISEVLQEVAQIYQMLSDSFPARSETVVIDSIS